MPNNTNLEVPKKLDKLLNESITQTNQLVTYELTGQFLD